MKHVGMRVSLRGGSDARCGDWKGDVSGFAKVKGINKNPRLRAKVIIIMIRRMDLNAEYSSTH